MLSYRYMFMSMRGNRTRSHRVSKERVLADFLVSPTDMDMKMHMVGLMYAPISRLTLSLMLPVVSKDMDHVTRMGGKFTTRAEAVADVTMAALISLLHGEHHRVHLNAGLSLPTGSISQRDDTPMGNQRLPYPMQIGSGTWDLLPGVTYTGNSDRWSWGGQVSGVVRIGRNGHGYRLGDAFNTTWWGARQLQPWVSASLRLAYADWSDVHHDDSALNPLVVPTADPDLRGGRRLDGLVGLNFVVPRGPLRGHRFAVEAGWPLAQNLHGPQLEMDWQITGGWQWAF